MRLAATRKLIASVAFSRRPPCRRLKGQAAASAGVHGVAGTACFTVSVTLAFRYDTLNR